LPLPLFPPVGSFSLLVWLFSFADSQIFEAITRREPLR
jgi:hypothetical protein